MSTEHNIGETGHSSVKVHAPPGGKSNWSIGGYNPITGGGQQDPTPPQSSGKKLYTKKTNFTNDIFHQNQTHGQQMNNRSETNIGESGQTSVKVHAPPGGGSNFSLAHAQNPNTQQRAPIGQGNTRFTQGYGQNQSNQQQPQQAQGNRGNVHTSVKVHNPPGNILHFIISNPC